MITYSPFSLSDGPFTTGLLYENSYRKAVPAASPTFDQITQPVQQTNLSAYKYPKEAVQGSDQYEVCV